MARQDDQFDLPYARPGKPVESGPKAPLGLAAILIGVAGTQKPGEPESPLTRTVKFIVFLWVLRVFVLFILPYGAYLSVRDCFRRAGKTNIVYIQELNETATPVAPFLSRDEAYCSVIYAKLSSFREARKWLQDHGYKCRRFEVDWDSQDHGPEGDIFHTPTESNYFKNTYRTFLVRGEYRDGKYDYLNESIVKIAVDYGDGEYHDLFFEHFDCEHPFDLSNFERIEPKIEFPVEGMSQYLSGGAVRYRMGSLWDEGKEVGPHGEKYSDWLRTQSGR